MIKYIMLSGISRQALMELEKNRVKTIEFRSPHNFLSVLETNVGDYVFLTSTNQEDVIPTTTGITAKILRKQIFMHKKIQEIGEIYEEIEFQAARLQLEMQGHAIVRKIESRVIGKPTIIYADEITFFEGM